MDQDKNLYYSEGIPKILHNEERLRIAKQIIGVLKVHLGSTKEFNCLDIGCSSGVITNYLSNYFKKIIGIDVDKPAILMAQKKYKQSNLKFYEMDGENLNFDNETFDVVTCNQVYNFVNNPQKLMNEIYRVLKKGGVCLFSARSKYAIIEPQYNLPFLSWLPSKLAVRYFALFNKGVRYFGKNYMSYFQLKSLVSKFKIHEYTLDVLKNPDKFAFYKYKKFSWFVKFLPKFIEPLLSNFIWLLKKI